MTKSVIALLVVIVFSGWSVWQSKAENFQRQVDEVELERAYEQSQYINPNSTAWIEDPPLYTLAGIRYLRGEDPSNINFELQPLTKYVFGATTKVAGNPLLAQLFLYLLFILLTFVLAQKIIGSATIAIFPTLLVSFDPLIRSHAYTAYLDLMQAVLMMFFLILAPRSKPIVVGLLIGLIALSKSFMMGILIFMVWGIFQISRKQLNWMIIVAGISAISIYFVGYTMFFISGHTLIDFINLHWQIVRLYRGYVPEYPKGEMFRILLIGQWRKWYGDFGLNRVDEWWIAWPVGLFGFALTIIKDRWSNLNPHSKLAVIFALLYGISIAMRLIFPRYLIPLLPLIYIFSVKVLLKSEKTSI